MKHLVPHDLPLDVAKKVAERALAAYQERFADFEPAVTWTSAQQAEVSFKAKGIGLKGNFEILKDAIAMDMDVPLLLRPFRQKAIDVVEREIRAWIDKAKNGELA